MIERQEGTEKGVATSVATPSLIPDDSSDVYPAANASSALRLLCASMAS